MVGQICTNQSGRERRRVKHKVNTHYVTGKCRLATGGALADGGLKAAVGRSVDLRVRARRKPVFVP